MAAKSTEEALKLERLRAAIQAGLDELDGGKGEIVEWTQLDAWLAARGRRGVSRTARPPH